METDFFSKPYFVILYCQKGVAAMQDDDGELALYGTRGEACAAAGNNVLGAHFGFEVHEVGAGEDGSV
jgi:hypothetical protein